MITFTDNQIMMVITLNIIVTRVLPSSQSLCYQSFQSVTLIRFNKVICSNDVSKTSVLWCCWLGGRKGIWPVKNMGHGGGRHWLVWTGCPGKRAVKRLWCGRVKN